MATLLNKIEGSPLGPVIWRFDNLPSNLGAEGVQVGDLVILGSGSMYTLLSNHTALLLAGGAPGSDFYVSPTGDNANSGLSPDLPRADIQDVHDNLVVSGNGDRINLIAFTNTTDFVENVTITKRDVSIRAAIPVGNARFATVAQATGVALTLSDSAWGFTSFGVRYVGAGAA